LTVSSLLIVGAAALFLGSRSSTPRLTPANIGRPQGTVGLVGYILRPPREIRGTLSFILTDRNRAGRVHVLYQSASPVSLRMAEEVNITGRYRNGLFLADEDSLIVNCGTQQHC
jgi:hypothetical protein